MSPPRHLLNTDLQQPFPQALRGEGIYLYDQAGRAHIDGCSGALECAQALEDALIAEGPETVAAFIAEPLVGAALAAAAPPAEYVAAVRRICDRHGVLLIAEEVMTGAGRTGSCFFASDHFPGRPDIIVFGKGVGGGYYPLAGVLVSAAVAAAIAAGPGGFAAGQSYSGHPVGMAAGGAVLDFFQEHDLLTRAAETGAWLGRRLEALRDHPSVGDVRGRGLMWGLEFVADQARKTPFDPRVQYYRRVYAKARENGLLLLPSEGCDHGRAGDMALIGPPLVISTTEVDTLVGILDDTLTQVERECLAG
jgi:adenosylmethionine-8-amino-7-oxononanoate aminotransferase